MMHSSPDAAALARALLALSRAAKTGVLTITSGGRKCQLALQRGYVVAATSTPAAPTLGDLLLHAGEFDEVAHAAALSGDALSREHDETAAAAAVNETSERIANARDDQPGAPPLDRVPDRMPEPPPNVSSSIPARAPIGAWLIASGVTSEAALERALAQQIKARLAAALRLRDVRHHFEPGSPDLGVPLLANSPATIELLMAGARESVDESSLQMFRSGPAGRRLVCSAFGRALLRERASFLSDRCARLVQTGASLAQLAAASGGDEAELRNLAALVWLAAVVPDSDQLGTYALLLRKRRQLEQRVSAAELLDLGPGNPTFPARRALRRLASRLHPDVLGPSAPAELREASTELMRALVHAEGSLRATK
jgi:hypothetical protein